MHALADVSLRESGHFATDSNYLSIHELRPMLGLVTVQSGDGDNRQKCEAEPWMEDPAVWELFRDGKGLGQPSLPEELKLDDSSGSEADSDGTDSTLDNFEALDELMEKRDALLGEHDDDVSDSFAWDIRGGKWTSKHKGATFDSFRARARTQEASAWCVQYSLKRSMTVSTKKYPERWCIFLCKMWIARMVYFYAIWRAHGYDNTYRFSLQDVKSFNEDPEVQIRLNEGCSKATVARVKSIRALRPR